MDLAFTLTAFDPFNFLIKVEVCALSISIRQDAFGFWLQNSSDKALF